MAVSQVFAASLLPKLLARSGWICAIFFALSIIYTLYAISENAVEPTRISENALLPGLVVENFEDSHAIALLEARLMKSMNNQK